MLFADWLADSFLNFLILMSLGLFATKRFFEKFDSDGVVKNAAKEGLASWILRKLK